MFAVGRTLQQHFGSTGQFSCVAPSKCSISTLKWLDDAGRTSSESRAEKSSKIRSNQDVPFLRLPKTLGVSTCFNMFQHLHKVAQINWVSSFLWPPQRAPSLLDPPSFSKQPFQSQGGRFGAAFHWAPGGLVGWLSWNEKWWVPWCFTGTSWWFN